MLRLVAVVPLLVLAARSSPSPTNTPAIKAAADKMRAIHDEDCEARHRRGELKTLGVVERCAAPRVRAVYAEAGYPYMDLIQFAEETRVAGAEKVDEGAINEAEYDRQRLVLRDRLAEEIRRRNDRAGRSDVPPGSGGELAAAAKARLVRGLSAFSALEE
jgi:hypothetical protein